MILSITDSSLNSGNAANVGWLKPVQMTSIDGVPARDSVSLRSSGFAADAGCLFWTPRRSQAE